jgi:diguanylate cyclase (GGDEF)-like protein
MVSGEQWQRDECASVERLERERAIPERRATASRAVGHDELTGLANGRLFTTIAPALLGEGRPAVALVVNVDSFHSVNETFGRSAGDELLRILARRLADSAGDDLAGRLDSDRFAAVLINPGPSAPRRWWRSTVFGVWAALTAPARVRGRTLRANVSIGVAPVRDGAPIHELLHRADDALRRAKAGGQPYAAWEPDAIGGELFDAPSDERTIEFTLVPAAQRRDVAA